MLHVTLSLFTEDEESNDKKKEKAEGESSSEAEKKSKGKQMIKVGAEYIKRVEVQYCELCKVYLPRSENTERAVALHCSTRSHLKRYIISMFISFNRISKSIGKSLIVFTIVYVLQVCARQ